MQPEIKKHLFDIAQAVDRQFLIVGEAMVRLRNEAPQVVTSISEWRSIIKFRNVLAHGYDVIKPGRVWDVVVADLPKLRAEVHALLAVK